MVERRVVPAMCALVVAVALLACAPAWASTADEVRQGQALDAQLQAGTTTCDRLDTDDFEHLGEFVMGRMTGSLRLHESMNDRMRSLLGASTEQRMHVLMGQRFAGCRPQGSGAWMGPRMMSGNDWGRMRSSDMWSWMQNGHWQQMSSADWHRVAEQWMAPGMMRAANNNHDSIWSEVAFGAVGLLVAGGLLGGLFVWRARRRGPAT